jgi:hypothetical protein
MNPEKKNEYKAKILGELTGHVGREKAIGMGELYETAFGDTWRNRINDTRRLRKVITELRWEGVPICSCSDRDGGGYYLAAAGSELRCFLERLKRRALKPLAMAARIEKTSLAEMLGQMSLNLKEGTHDDIA